MKQFWQRLSKRERGLVVTTLIILLLLVGRLLVVNPYLQRREWVQTQLEIQPQLLEKNLRYVGRKEELAAALEAAQNEIKSRDPKLLTGDTASVNASDLQETVQALAVKEGTQVITTRVLNPESTGAFSKIAIQMEIGGQVEQIANLVRGIETSPKLLVIDEINVRSLFRPIGFPRPRRHAPGRRAKPASQFNGRRICARPVASRKNRQFERS
ncbi:MAG: type II secretion system protein GspM [Candidatus Binatia bacterium]